MRRDAELAGADSPLVSVVMNCYNGERYLSEALDCVYAQTYQNWEIVFVDNASTDRSADIARAYGARVKYVRNETTVPLGASRNIALRHCAGEFIAFLDCDDRWEPQKLERQIPRFSNPRVGLVYSNCWLFTDKHRLGLRYTSSRDYAVGESVGPLLANYFVVLSTAVIRRSVLSQLDEWFDPALRLAEEADVFIRIALVAELDMVAEPLASYRLHSKSESATRSELYGVENQLIIDKLARLVPDFDTKYGSEAEQWRNLGRWSTAVSAWKRGSGHTARQAIKSISRRGVRHNLLYLVTPVPYEAMRGLLNIARRRSWRY
jgi:glycosyltransferase involved in cell wall biosynthesis